MAHDVKKIRLNYKPTSKNQPALNFLRSLEEVHISHQEDTGICFVLDVVQGKRLIFDPDKATSLEPLSEGLKVSAFLSTNHSENCSQNLMETTTRLTTVDLIQQAIDSEYN